MPYPSPSVMGLPQWEVQVLYEVSSSFSLVSLLWVETSIYVWLTDCCVVADPSVRQIGSEFDRLTRDNLATIKSFGSQPMDIICRDACDGHNVGRVSRLHVFYFIV